MKKTARIGKKVVTFFVTAGLVAGSALPVYAAMVGSMAVEENTVVQSESEQMPQGDVIALDDIGISVQVSDYTAIRQDDGFVYIYAMADESIPYVIIGKYDAASVNFVNEFTKYMAENYSDLQVSEDMDTVELEGRIFTKIGYTYTTSGYVVRDRRHFFSENDITYNFGTKEIESLVYYTEHML